MTNTSRYHPVQDVADATLTTGLLYPNDDAGRGEGYVSYTVAHLPDLPSGTEITNRADIIFDFNDPIRTPLVTNTLDAQAPNSQVAALPPTTTETTFTLNWSGQDDVGGSGIATYRIYVSIAGGPFALILDDTTTTSLDIEGVPGTSYVFYSVATDNVGHIEAAPEVPDAYITIVSPEQLAIEGPAQGVRSQPLDFTLSMNQPGQYRYEIDWDSDGAFDESVVGPSDGVVVTKAYGEMGAFTFLVLATNTDTGASAEASQEVQIATVTFDGTTLMIGGNADSERIVISSRNNGDVLVRIGTDYAEVHPPGEQVVVFGGEGDDVISVAASVPVRLHGGPGDDYLAGGSLDDELFGGEGNDRLLGGEGNNRLDGGPGDDRLVGRGGADILLGGPGNDVLQGGDGLNFLDGGEGDDLLAGGVNDDVLLGGAGNDTLSGNLGNDILVAGLGNDQLMGSDGRDVLFAGAGRDSLRAGAGNDLLVSNRSQLDDLAAADFEQAEQLDAALRSILADWQRDVFDPNVLLGDDEDEDDLLGELGADWFFAEDNDRVRDLRELEGDRVS